MNGPKAKKRNRETEIQEVQDRCKDSLADITPMVDDLPAEAAEEVVKELEKDVQKAGEKVKEVEKKNGSNES